MAQEFATGLIKRDYAQFPSGCEASAPTAPDSLLVPENEWEERLKEQKANKSSLLDLRNENYAILKSLNQGQHPICWGFSTTKAGMYLAVQMGEPIVISPWFVAGMADNWRNRGGWNQMSLNTLATLGGPSMDSVPRYDSSLVTQAVKDEAAKTKIFEWWDGTQDRDRNRALMISAFLLGKIPVLDLNWMGHSMCGCFLDSINPLVVYTDNSWGEISQYGPQGLYKLTGAHAIPDGLSIPRAITPRK